MSIRRSRYRGLPRSYLLHLITLVLGLLALTGGAFAGSVNLAWDAVSGASGYRVSYGTTSAQYTANLDAGSNTSAAVAGLTDGTRYYFAVRAYAGTVTSGYSNEVSAIVRCRDRGAGGKLHRQRLHRLQPQRHSGTDGYLGRYLHRHSGEPLLDPGGRHVGHLDHGGQDLCDDRSQDGDAVGHGRGPYDDCEQDNQRDGRHRGAGRQFQREPGYRHGTPGGEVHRRLVWLHQLLVLELRQWRHQHGAKSDLHLRERRYLHSIPDCRRYRGQQHGHEDRLHHGDGRQQRRRPQHRWPGGGLRVR